MNILFFLVSYQVIKMIKSNSNFYKIGDFGFDTNSSFFVEFSDIKSKNIMYCLFSDKEYSSYSPGKLPVSHICESQSPFPKLRYFILPTPKPYTINGSIKDPGIYSQVIVNCDDSDLYPIQTALTIYQHFKNPSTTLDLRWNGIQRAKPIVVSVFSVVFSIWMLYLIFFAKLISCLQYLLSFTFLMYLVSSVIRLFEIQHLEKYDNDSGLGSIREFVVCIQKVALYLTVLFISKGWKIIINEMPSDIKYYVWLILVFCGIQLVAAFFHNQNVELAELIVSAFCACLVILEILFSINEIKRFLLTKLINSLNSPELQSSEISRLRLRYSILSYHIIIFVFIDVCRILVSLFIPIPYWIIETSKDSIMICFLTVLMFLFHKKIEFNIDYFEGGIPLMQMDPLNETDTNTKIPLDSTAFNIEAPPAIDDN